MMSQLRCLLRRPIVTAITKARIVMLIFRIEIMGLIGNKSIATTIVLVAIITVITRYFLMAMSTPFVGLAYLELGYFKLSLEFS